MNKTKHVVCILISCILFCTTVLTGCRKDSSVEAYREKMEQYFDALADLNYQMNSVDADSSDAQNEMLAFLDELDRLTADMAQIDVPEDFSLVESLADEAADNMSSAVSLYHQLYAADEYNESVAEGAYEYYERANMRIRYIRSILQGDIPEELNISDDTDSE